MPERDANIERLFHLVMETNNNTANIRSDISILTTKIDDFSARLKKLEERDEKHAEREEDLRVLTTEFGTLLESIKKTIVAGEERMTNLDERLTAAETAITRIQNNWGWVVTIVSAAGSIIGYILTTVINLIRSLH